MLLPIREHMTAKRIARFWSRVSVAGPDDCWLWQGRCTPAGYGAISFSVYAADGSEKTVNFLAHRVAKTLALGRDLTEPLLRHSCNVKPCCNPAHLIEGDHMANYVDSVAARTAVLGIEPCVFRGVVGVAHPASRFSEAQRARAIELWKQGFGLKRTAFLVGCHRTTVSRWLYDAFPGSFTMPAAVRRVRTAPEHASAVAQSEARASARREARETIRARTADLAALAAPSKSC